MNIHKWMLFFQFTGMLCLFSTPAWAWSEEQVDAVAAQESTIGDHSHSTFHYELTKLLAYEAGFPLTEAESIARYDVLVDLLNPQENYPNPGVIEFGTLFDSIPEWTESLAGTERTSNARNSWNETPGVYWHFPFRNSADPVCGALVYGARYPIIPPPAADYTQSPYYWRLTQTFQPDYLTAMKQWAISGQGQPGFPNADAPDTAMYYDPVVHGYVPVQPGTLMALAIFLHCLADCYSHEQCMIEDTIRSHPPEVNCSGAYHYMELPYATNLYAYTHADRAAQAVWRALRAYIQENNLGYGARWTTDNNGFEDGDGVPDELEDNGNLNHTESFIERFKAPELTDLNGDGNTNHYDHTLHRIRLVMDLLPQAQAVELSSLLPSETVLQQNYPNPFNLSTQIVFDLQESGLVVVKVFNPVGQVVKTLINGNLNAGRHTLTFDASRLSSGLYMARLETKNFVGLKKMLLIK